MACFLPTNMQESWNERYFLTKCDRAGKLSYVKSGPYMAENKHEISSN